MLVFETFDRTGRRDGARLGLGFHIVHQSAQSLGHPVVVQSRCGRGSIFGVTVDAARRELASFG
ncbi:ATP-binding protein [Methylobacterium sp. Gmos1]